MSQPETVLFLPATNNSKLRKALQAKDNQFAALHNVPPERGGEKLSQMVGTPDPWGGYHCGHKDCTPCNDNTPDAKLAAPKGACSSESCLYTLECILCERNDLKERAQYWGESGRSGYTRGKEHSEGVRRGDVTHPMVKHMMEHHRLQR